VHVCGPTAYQALTQFMLLTCESLLTTNFENDLKDVNLTIDELRGAGIPMEVLVTSCDYHVTTSHAQMLRAVESNGLHVGNDRDSRNRRDASSRARPPPDPVVMSEVALTPAALLTRPMTPSGGVVEIRELDSEVSSSAVTFSPALFSHTLLAPQQSVGSNMASVSASVISRTITETVSDQTSQESSIVELDGRFRFLKEKILPLRLWYHDDLRLFHELKESVQRRMDVYASICLYKLLQVAHDANGPALMALESKNTSDSVTRQDHESVRAVRVDDESRREVTALFENQIVEHSGESVAILGLGPSHSVPSANSLNEEVFVTQLAVRALAIDEEFQLHVKSILHTRSVAAVMVTKQKCIYECQFKSGVKGDVSLFRAPVKSRERMREKLIEYLPDEFPDWPLVGYVLDPV